MIGIYLVEEKARLIDPRAPKFLEALLLQDWYQFAAHIQREIVHLAGDSQRFLHSEP